MELDEATEMYQVVMQVTEPFSIIMLPNAIMSSSHCLTSESHTIVFTIKFGDWRVVSVVPSHTQNVQGSFRQ